MEILVSGQQEKRNCLPKSTKLKVGLQDMSKSATHYLPDGKIYKGKLHKAGGVLMTGAKHTPESKVLTHTPPKPKAKK